MLGEISPTLLGRSAWPSRVILRPGVMELTRSEGRQLVSEMRAQMPVRCPSWPTRSSR
jgi:hypothetical protein